jgi:DNA-binding CsgD family transcriptional regulator
VRIEVRVKVRGISILTRKAIVTRRFGAEAWARFYRDVAGAHPCFRSFVTAESLVPLPAYLAFHEELIRRFFKDDEASNIELGRESGRWALTEGPFRMFTRERDLAGFVATLPEFHNLYFEGAESWSEAALSRDSVEFKVFGLPQWHPYLEHFIVGYVAETLELFCANPIRATRLRGGGGRDYHYLFHGAQTEGSVERSAGPHRTLRVIEGGRYLSDREIEVLVLVAEGKTNEEIGIVLGMSKKTAQHQVTRTCRKIGVKGRVGAAVWLTERGLVGT